MKQATIKFTGSTPISFGRFHNTPKLDKESNDDQEKRTWKEKCHYDQDNDVVVTSFMIKNMLSDAAKFLSIQVPGKGKATYTKHFEAGILVLENMKIGIKKEDVKGTWLHVPSDGRRGGTSRVLKCFPVIFPWSGEVTVFVLDETITKDVLAKHLKEAGQFIGMGSLRPRNNGIFGRFSAEVLSFTEHEVT